LKSAIDERYRNDQFTEVLGLVRDAVKTLQQLPCTFKSSVSEFVDRTNLIDEGRMLLKMCIDVQQRIGGTVTTDSTPSSVSSRGCRSPEDSFNLF
uniref:DHC_N1 domain-containing protein n=1 Tax=Gongylonema pulchrum TaxID=637853 RepID=A0A183DRD1_9BILA